MLACGIRSRSGIQCSSRIFDPTLLGVTDRLVTPVRHSHRMPEWYGPGRIPTYHKEVPSWVSSTKPLGVANVEMISHSQQVNKSSTSKRGWWISPVVVLPVAPHDVICLADRGIVLSVLHAKCTRWFAPSAVPRLRCHSYPRMIALSIAAPVTTKSV